MKYKDIYDEIRSNIKIYMMKLDKNVELYFDTVAWKFMVELFYVCITYIYYKPGHGFSSTQLI